MNSSAISRRVLVIGYVWPEPRSSAAGSRIVQLLQCFRGWGWQVTFASAAARTEQCANLSLWQVREEEIALNCSSFNEFIASLQPDVVIFDRFVTEEQFGWRLADTCPDALRILDTEDLHSLRYAREKLLKHARQGFNLEAEKHGVGPVDADMHALFEVMAQDSLAKREIASIYRCDLSLMISGYEMQLLQRAFNVPPALLWHLPFMLELDAQPQPAFEARQHFVAIGNFRHAPNWDAVLWLKHIIWPKIRAQLPGAELHIYGSYPPPKATALHNPKQGFQVCGWAEDAHRVMRQARVCLAPLRFGAGLKGKLIDALQCGTPSVTTSIGSEGMTASVSWPGAVADNADDFAAAAVQLYQNADLWQAAQARCNVHLQPYERDALQTQLQQQLEALAANIADHRRQNFIGAMLNHHHHKSTQYMSQWIELKSRFREQADS
jgi:glycosyltransferase involved in cell wall biosynthesis